MTGEVVARPTRHHEVVPTFVHGAPHPDRAATIRGVKRPIRAWPKSIVEVPSKRSDPRADPQATQKISREMLDDALRRTKSGTRPITRSQHDVAPSADDEGFVGPRDSAPEITIVKIDSMEMSVFDPSTLPQSTHSPSHVTPISVENRAVPAASSPALRRLHVTPRMAFAIGLAVVAFVSIAAVVGFFAGRLTLH